MPSEIADAVLATFGGTAGDTNATSLVSVVRIAGFQVPGMHGFFSVLFVLAFSNSSIATSHTYEKNACISPLIKPI